MDEEILGCQQFRNGLWCFRKIVGFFLRIPTFSPSSLLFYPLSWACWREVADWSYRHGQAAAPPPSRAPLGKSTVGNRATPSSSTANRSVSAASSIQLQQLNAQVEEMQLAYDGIERERMFYFESELIPCPLCICSTRQHCSSRHLEERFIWWKETSKGKG